MREEKVRVNVPKRIDLIVVCVLVILFIFSPASAAEQPDTQFLTSISAQNIPGNSPVIESKQSLLMASANAATTDYSFNVGQLVTIWARRSAAGVTIQFQRSEDGVNWCTYRTGVTGSDGYAYVRDYTETCPGLVYYRASTDDGQVSNVFSVEWLQTNPPLTCVPIPKCVQPVGKTFSITNNWVYEDGVEKGKTKPAGDTYFTNVKEKLMANGWTQVGPGGGPPGREKDIVGPDIVPRFFGGTSPGLSANINDATIHWHMSHGYPSYFIGENGKPFPQPGHTDGHTSIQLFDKNYNAVEFQASQIQNKWGGKNKWVVLQSCYILNDSDWGTKLGTTHGILGFSTAVDILPGISSEFLMNAIDKKKPIAESWKDAAVAKIGNKPAPTHYNADRKPDYEERTTDTIVAVIFKNDDQYKNDHLPGLAEYIAPDGPDDGNFVRYAWSCATGNEVKL